MSDMLKRFVMKDDFLGRYERLVLDSVIPYQEKALQDEIPDAEKSHAVENFRQAARVIETGTCEGVFYGMVFQDSDVAKWLEAVAYSLALEKNPELEKRADEMIQLICRAQHKDGYLNTYFTVKEPDKRWTNLQEAHELYCAGHMIEAAVAYFETTGKTELLDCMVKMADHIYQHFIEEKAEGYPGHPEIELALMRLYRATGMEKYLELVRHFVDVRGVDADYFVKEAGKKGWQVWGMDPLDKEYAQNQAPIRELTEATGHAVRLVYLFTGVADLAQATGDESLIKACKRIWNNITQKRMYITGGIGSAFQGEAFTKDYHLPNDTAYAETCASVGLIFFAEKMIEIEKNGTYADVAERALYNTVLAGMQLDGQRFFYVNPLEVLPGISGEAVTHRHALPQRQKWFGCACCPPNVARLLTSIANYAWDYSDDVVYSHLYIGGELDLPEKNTRIEVRTEYPYENEITYVIYPEDRSRFTLAVRIPAWSEEAHIYLNGKSIFHKSGTQKECLLDHRVETREENGYVYIKKQFVRGDEIKLSLDMEPVRIFPNTKIAADSNKVAFMRGPLVYCVEGIDHQGDVLSLRVDSHAEPVMEAYRKDKALFGIAKMKIPGFRIEQTSELYTARRPKQERIMLTAIPYYAWGNRGLNEMRVWIPEI